MSFPIDHQDPHIEAVVTAMLGKGATEPQHRQVRTDLRRLLEKVYNAAVIDAQRNKDD